MLFSVETITLLTTLLLSIILGVVLCFRGRPYNSVACAVHIAASAACIIACVFVFDALYLTNNVLISLAIAVISVIALVVSGSVMSSGRRPIEILRLVHTAATVMLVLSAASLISALK